MLAKTGILCTLEARLLHGKGTKTKRDSTRHLCPFVVWAFVFLSYLTYS